MPGAGSGAEQPRLIAVRIDPKGRIILPPVARQALRVKPNQSVFLLVREGSVVLGTDPERLKALG
ncbi:MAG: AbrB/MazE/SpoVT family DNA-binding domain-containing protein [Firmicutes bacterium]|nr:AbrB/MazE/SpoVT family DNA-binding domain-containing protein [Bacillota bacterium]